MSDLSLGALSARASRGIGAAIAESLAAHGARVAVHYGRGKAGAEEVAQRILAAGGPEPVVLGARLEHEDERRKLHRDVASALGDPLLLVNNAALWDAPFDEPDDALFSPSGGTRSSELNAAPISRSSRFPPCANFRPHHAGVAGGVCGGKVRRLRLEPA
jgi:NAD(P)-dependent dehydrogenase (short-subunit alcohol dehydrogenase family)